MIRSIVVGGPAPVAESIADALRGDEGRVVLVGTCSASAVAGDEVRAQIARATLDLGGLDLLVVLGWDEVAATPRTLVGTDDEAVEAIWEGSMQSMLWSIQSAIPALRASRGSIALILPTTGMSGGAAYALAAAAWEGQRILAKAASRQLAPDGIAVNSVCLGPEFVLDDPGAADVHFLAPPAAQPTPAEVVATATGFVLFAHRSPRGLLTGQTMVIDGGRWLAP